MGSAAGTPLLHGKITSQVLRCFYRVYDRLGFGFLESVYCNALAHELTGANISYEREVPIQVWYDGMCIGAFRADFVVAGQVIVEAKASELVNEAHRKQLMNYMRCSTLEVGLLLHFGPKATFQRIVYTNTHKLGLPAPK
ncbi:MAG TPA: GxxExxY protein [Gemmatimonadaceae bacterium]